MRAPSKAKLSIVIPVYFNQETLHELHRQLSAIAESLRTIQTEFVFVDDGSGDRSFEILKTLVAIDERVKLVKLARNFGSNVAILAGMTHATGDAVAFVAADLQDPPQVLSDMVLAWHAGSKVVFAVRNSRDDPPISRVFASAFNILFHRLVMNDAPPTGIGFFLIDRQVVELVIRCEEKNANIMNLIVWLGFHPYHILYDRPGRQRGKSRWTFRKKIKYAIDTFVAFSYLPIRLTSLAGIALSIIGALVIAYVIIARLFLGVNVEGWASLMIVTLIVSGVQMVMLGVLGEYLWRTLDQTRKRPIFVVDTIVVAQPKEQDGQGGAEQKNDYETSS